MLLSSLFAEDFFVPEPFREGQIIEHIILISDVDGVIRDSTDGVADPRVIQSVHSLLKHKGVAVTFISGTPINNDSSVEPWRKGNVPLNQVFGHSFAEELRTKRVTIFGVLGGHQMKEDGTLEVVDEYAPQISWELASLLVRGFLNEVNTHGTDAQKEVATQLLTKLDSLLVPEKNSSNLTPHEFYEVVAPIREHIDPNFRLVSNGALIETQTSNPPWNTSLSSKWLHEEIHKPHYLISQLPLQQKQLASGFGKKGDEGFNFLVISKTNKGITTKAHINEKLALLPNALVVTIGDTQVDFPMHENAHLAFHVGLEHVWQSNPLPHCVMIRNEKGEDCQHVEGTLKVLSLLENALGKSFFDLKYIPHRSDDGHWSYHSIRELNKETL